MTSLEVSKLTKLILHLFHYTLLKFERSPLQTSGSRCSFCCLTRRVVEFMDFLQQELIHPAVKVSVVRNILHVINSTVVSPENH